MDYIGIVASAVCVVVALLSAAAVAPRLAIEPPSDRHAPIDGLRGIAALLVFFCHAALWYYFAKSGLWANAPVRVYGGLGLLGVIVFFMITAFLFVSKLQHARTKGLDWLRLFVSRFLRLTPLYLFTVLIVLLSVAGLSGLQIKEGVSSISWSVAHWLLFTLFGTPDINGFSDTWMLLAGVTWSLRYEWWFYFVLPLLALTFRVHASWPVIIATSVAATWVFVAQLKLVLALPFLGGAAAVWLCTFPGFRRFASGRAASLGALLAIVISLAAFSSPLKPAALVFTAAAFALIAGGNPLFGILVSRSARLLGEVSYSMYLLHGLVLYGLVHGAIGLETVAAMSPWFYWAIIVGTMPILVALCMVTFVVIERPAMRQVPRVTAAIRTRLPRLRLSS